MTTQGPPPAKGRVLVFSGHFFPHVGGVERYCRELWSRLVARGWEVALFTSNTDGAAGREPLFGMDVVRAPVVKIFRERLPLLTPTPALWTAVQAVGRPRPDVIVTNTRFFPTTVLGQLLARRWRVPTLHIDHGSEHIALGGKMVTALGERYDHLIGGWVVRQATQCVGVSASVAAFLAHLGRPDAGVLYNGVDAASFAGRSAAQRGRFGVTDARPVLLYVGRLIEDKGIMVLLEAYRRLPVDRRPHLIVAGDGHMRPQVEAFAAGAPEVHVLGRLDPETVKELLGCADVFVHPSHYPEGLPTAVLEAGAAGRAVVATPMGGTAEIIPDEDHGLVVPHSDPDALAGALATLLADPARRQRMGRKLQARVRALFDWEQIADDAEARLERLVRSS